jgi:hypothetical protein
MYGGACQMISDVDFDQFKKMIENILPGFYMSKSYMGDTYYLNLPVKVGVLSSQIDISKAIVSALDETPYIKKYQSCIDELELRNKSNVEEILILDRIIKSMQTRYVVTKEEPAK